MNVDDIHWYGHDSFRIDDGSKHVYIDPWKMPAGAPQADLILVTHDHYDHYSEDDVRRLSGPRTKVVGPPDVAEKVAATVAASEGAEALFINAGQTLDVDGIKVTAVPAYNVGKKFHPRASGWVGYLVTLGDGTRLYHAGDTDHVPEMNDLEVDVALLPVSGTYVMTAQEAVQAANAMKPKVAVPMHYGEIVGTEKDAQTFKAGFHGRTVIKQPEK